MRRSGPGEVERHGEVVRRRVRCSSSDCPARDWTIYEDGAYPHRSFQLDVVADAVAEVVVGPRTLSAVAAAHACGRDSVRRWVAWVARLAEPDALEQLCARIDPDALVMTRPRREPPAATTLRLLERLADLLALRGAPISRAGPGLARVLVGRLLRFGEVVYLTKFSPPLRADLGALSL